MKTLYLDIFSGLSGDMFLGALLDLGLPLAHLERELSKVHLHGYHLHAARQHKASIEGVKFDVHDHDHGDEPHKHEEEHGHGHSHAHVEVHGHAHGAHDHVHEHHHEEDYHGHAHSHDDHDHADEHGHEHVHGRTFAEIRKLIKGSHLSPWVKEKSIAVFARIARAEGQIHGMPPEQVHFHEVGALDSIVDIIGACAGLEYFGKPRVLAAPVIEGTGFIQCAHGRFPVPAPATLAILAERGVPISQCEEPHELLTPTGAALLAEFAENFAPLRDFTVERIGYGLGQRDNKTRPNVVRALLGQSAAAASAQDWETDSVAVLETNLDDINPEILAHTAEKALAEGALDVFHTPIQMKKGRPGTLLTVLCAASEQDRFTELLLRETTALGIRRTLAERRKLKRKMICVPTPYGEIEVKLGLLDGKTIQASPEFESCKKAAAEQGAPLKEVYQAAAAAAEKKKG